MSSFLVSHINNRAASTWAIFCTLSGTVGRSWIGAGGARTRTIAHMDCWCCRYPLSPLQHNSNPAAFVLVNCCTPQVPIILLGVPHSVVQGTYSQWRTQSTPLLGRLPSFPSPWCLWALPGCLLPSSESSVHAPSVMLVLVAVPEQTLPQSSGCCAVEDLPPALPWLPPLVIHISSCHFLREAFPKCLLCLLSLLHLSFFTALRSWSAHFRDFCFSSVLECRLTGARNLGCIWLCVWLLE